MTEFIQAIEQVRAEHTISFIARAFKQALSEEEIALLIEELSL